jgi:hypothetical protein
MRLRGASCYGATWGASAPGDWCACFRVLAVRGGIACCMAFLPYHHTTIPPYEKCHCHGPCGLICTHAAAATFVCGACQLQRRQWQHEQTTRLHSTGLLRLGALLQRAADRCLAFHRSAYILWACHLLGCLLLPRLLPARLVAALRGPSSGKLAGCGAGQDGAGGSGSSGVAAAALRLLGSPLLALHEMSTMGIPWLLQVGRCGTPPGDCPQHRPASACDLACRAVGCTRPGRIQHQQI